MDNPVIYYINLAFAWFLVLVSVWGYSTIVRKTGQKMVFWLLFGLAWVFFGFSHIFTLGGADASDWYMITLRTAGYVMIFCSVISLMIHIVNKDSI
ncbi:MAG TPA: hypothetical protein VLH15_01510 [Dehalococcoidales bacterium]|nr:hypothetical protein [Dehalococcoidales bacterium]